MSELSRNLLAVLCEMEVIDAHEHLWPEAYHLRHRQDVLTLLQYSLADLQVAGATPQEIELLTAYHEGPKGPLEERWTIFRKYLPAIRHTAPLRALLIALRDLYGAESLDDRNYQAVSEQIQRARRPGLYEDMLRQRCKIRAALNQNPEVKRSDGFLLPIRNFNELGGLDSRPALEALGREAGTEVRSLDDTLGAMRAMFDRWEADGTVAVKRAGTALTAPDHREAREALAAVLESWAPTPRALPLQHYMEQEFIAEAGRRGWPVCVHCGLWAGTWGDMRQAHPEYLIPVALRHRETRFDVYHAGIPWVSTVGVMGRMLPNTWLNLCWAHVISPVMTRRALDEWLDVVPFTKIIAWGGDYWMALEKVYGHLVMARENVAEVLAGRVARGLMTESQALRVAEAMFRTNAEALYGLQDRSDREDA